MGATNKTQNYNLPQFVGSDKPTWLGDFNSAMSAIDTQMKANNDLGNNANNTANTALENAQNAQSTASSAQETAGSAQSTATSALEKSLKNETDIAKFNLTDFTSYSGSQMTSDNGSVPSYSNLTIAKNSDGSICKIYGKVFVNAQQNGAVNITIPNTGLKPKSNINISDCGLVFYINNIVGCTVTIQTDGTIVIHGNSDTSGTDKRITLVPVLIFVKDFGDTTNQ